jgi:tetraacyldisaccharide 4'-kinase
MSELLLRLARRLEAGRGLPLGSAVAPLWGLVSGMRTVRPLRLPEGAVVIGVGGSTLGGSGKTPCAIALARALRATGETVVMVGHAYRAAPASARIVGSQDDWRAVGDDALHAARSLSHDGVEVVVAPSRQAAVDFAARRARVLVVDGLLQTRPARLAASVLAVDATRPWGSGFLPPKGDLAAPEGALRAAADHVMYLLGPPEHAASRRGTPIPLGDLAREKVGIILGVARPDRILRDVEVQGIRASIVLRFADHIAPSSSLLETAREASRTLGLRGWLCTGKCAVKLPGELGGAPVLALVHEPRVPADLLAALLAKIRG